ncbi:MAG: dihydrofolate reductase family protein [Bacteroidia bacterium]
MRKVKLFIACSADGYIATPDGGLDFLSTVEQPGEDYGYATHYATIDTVVLGRKTYEKVLSFGMPFPHSCTTYIITSKPQPPQGNIHFYHQGPVALIRELLQQPGKDIFVDGGAEVIHALMQEQLIHEMTISVIPVLLGSGIRLFKEGFSQQVLTLMESKSFPSGLVQMTYSVNSPKAAVHTPKQPVQ